MNENLISLGYFNTYDATKLVGALDEAGIRLETTKNEEPCFTKLYAPTHGRFGENMQIEIWVGSQDAERAFEMMEALFKAVV